MSWAVQSCSRCSRVNPTQGVYCFACGVALGNADRQAVAVGSRPFPMPFVFPNGKSCRSFDELALACQNDWSVARELLQGGYLESFLGGMGRLDLALAAKEAARFPDQDRGLDQFLGKLPTLVLPEARLRVDPTELALGLLEGSQPRSFVLELENQGGRLLFGTISTDCLWITLGEGNTREKAIHFTHDERIAVHVHSDRIRASNRPLEAKIVLSTNAGMQTVLIRAEKPIKPFSGGLLTGAKSPRQIAELAMKNPKEVSPFFETGEVERWYVENGWVYPVKLPAASGLAAIQQFFEALGVTRPPRVEIDRRLITLRGAPGERLQLSIGVSTQEKRPVFAHVTSNSPWIEIGRASFAGKQATVPMSIPRVPAQPGQTLQAELTVVSNGNVRWQVPVLLEITDEVIGVDEPGDVLDFTREAVTPPLPPSLPPIPPLPPPVRSGPPAPPRGPSRTPSNLLLHALPAVFLLLVLGCVVLYDRLRPVLLAPEVAEADILGPRYNPRNLADARPRVGVSYTSDMRFGVVRLDQHDPNNQAGHKRLTFSEFGETNSTMVRINGFEYRFGDLKPDRDWVPGKRSVDLPAPYLGRQSSFRFAGDQVEVTQYIQIVPGQTNLLDTVLVYYRARNYGTVPRKVQVRLLLDTFIGENDSVPFLVPGKSELTRGVELKDAQVPEYLEAVENPNDPRNPGTIVRLGLRNLRWGKIDPRDPAEVVIGQRVSSLAWRPEFATITDDSSIALFWPEVEMEPRSEAHFAMTYGLGTLEISNDLGLSAPGTVMPDREFTVTAYVYKATKGQSVKLELPPQFRLAAGETAEKAIESSSERTQLFWRVRATREGEFTLQAQSERTRSRPVRVVVKSSGVFG